LFYYIDATSYGASLLGSSDAIPALKKLHTNQFLNKRSEKTLIVGNPVMERLALLELMLARALAYSGSTIGLNVLIDYLDDARAVLAGFAHLTLERVTGKDFGKSSSEWKKYVAENQGSFYPTPITKRIDG